MGPPWLPRPQGLLPWPPWCCGRVCLLRLMQYLLAATTVASLVYVLIACVALRPRGAATSVPHTATPTSPLATLIPGPPPLPPLTEVMAMQRAPPEDSLLDLKGFHFIHDAPNACEDFDDLLLVVLVHSHPAHAHRRQAIRRAWGGRRRLAGGWSTTVFLLGEDPSKGAAGALPTAAVVAAEARHFGDLVVGSFRDEYHQLRYKHAMALRWAHRHCAHAAHVVKADDDAFVDLYSLEALLGRTFPQGRLPPDTLACHVVPRGTAPQREGKWAVGVEEYPWAEYPAYCAGLAYVTTPATAHRLYLAAGVAPHHQSSGGHFGWAEEYYRGEQKTKTFE